MVKTGAYVKATGPLAGTYRSYYAYQTARSQSMGFRSYAQERAQTGIGNPLTSYMINRAVSARGENRAAASAKVRAWYRTQGYKGASVPTKTPTYSEEQGRHKHDAIAYMVDQNWATTGDEIAEDVPY